MNAAETILNHLKLTDTVSYFQIFQNVNLFLHILNKSIQLVT